jgi:hypothetical protein
MIYNKEQLKKMMDRQKVSSVVGLWHLWWEREMKHFWD